MLPVRSQYFRSSRCAPYISDRYELEEQLSKVIQMDERHLVSCIIK